MQDVQHERTRSRRKKERRKEKRREKVQNYWAWSRATHTILGLTFPGNHDNFIVRHMRMRTFICVLTDPNTAASLSDISRSFIVARGATAIFSTATSLLQERPRRLWHLEHVWESAIRKLAAGNPKWRVGYVVEYVCDVMDAFICARQRFLETRNRTNDSLYRVYQDLVKSLDGWMEVEAQYTFMSKTRRIDEPEPPGPDDAQSAGSAEHDSLQLGELKAAWQIYTEENRISRHKGLFLDEREGNFFGSAGSTCLAGHEENGNSFSFELDESLSGYISRSYSDHGSQTMEKNPTEEQEFDG